MVQGSWAARTWGGKVLSLDKNVGRFEEKKKKVSTPGTPAETIHSKKDRGSTLRGATKVVGGSRFG